MLLFLFISCGYKFNTETNESLAIGKTTCETLENSLVKYCVNVYNGYRTCYRGNLDYIITCDEYDRAISEEIL